MFETLLLPHHSRCVSESEAQSNQSEVLSRIVLADSLDQGQKAMMSDDIIPSECLIGGQEWSSGQHCVMLEHKINVLQTNFFTSCGKDESPQLIWSLADSGRPQLASF